MRGTRLGRTVLACAIGWALACTPASEPATFEVVHLSGTPYERGLQHGRRCASKIRSLYTRLLTTSLLPYLNRERPDIASVLTEYRKPRYDDGRFSYEFLLDSGRRLEAFLPQEYRDEMRGIADGADLPYDQILLLNTFMDSLFNMRSITFFIRELQAPTLVRVVFEGAEQDGVDNDADGRTDESQEGVLDPYEPSPWASIVEVPRDTAVRLYLRDQPPLTDPTDPNRPGAEGVAPDSIRLQWGLEVVEARSDPRVSWREVAGPAGPELEVTFRPTNGFPARSVVSLLVQAGDRSWVTQPPPAHARIMRDERITFTTRGVGLAPWEVPNRGEPDGRTQPPSVALAVRGRATPDGAVRLAHHFAMLDSNVSHQHTVLFIHHPPDGPVFAVLGWTGVVWGFSGMNEAGVAYAVNLSDTLNNGMVQQILQHVFDLGEARLEASGTPVGVVGREILAHASSVDDAARTIAEHPPSYGWNYLLVDANRKIQAVEVHCDILDDSAGGFYSFTPDAADPDAFDAHSRRWASIGPDDLRLASHAIRRTEDISLNFFGLFEIRPQRFWTSFYFRSLRAFYRLGEEVARRYGMLDPPALEEVLSTADLVDTRDSMNAVVFEPESLRLHVAAGQVPATDGPFRTFDLAELSRVSGGAR